MVIFIGIVLFILILTLLILLLILIDEYEDVARYDSYEVVDNYPPKDEFTDLSYRLYDDYIQLNQEALNAYKELIRESMMSRCYRD